MFDRRKRRKSKTVNEFAWPAPIAGLIKSGSLIGADPRGCDVLDNWIPTAEGARLRGGAARHATVAGDVVQMFTYRSGTAESLFAATSGTICNVTSPASPTVEVIPSVSGLNGGDWSSVQFATAGGQFVVAVNGVDKALRYDGSAWNVGAPEAQHTVTYDALTGYFEAGQTVTGGGKTAVIFAVLPATATTGALIVGSLSAWHFTDNTAITAATGSAMTTGASADRSAATFTGVSTEALSFVWSHKKRLWFVEGGTLSAWYLPVNSFAGVAAEFPLDGVFRLGGSLLFGGTWSQDSGSGLDDLAVFVTTEGEVAIYEGSDPSSADDWALAGVFVIGRPLAKNAWFRAGGDLVILTEDGIVPVSEALRKDRAALQAAAISAPIEALWQKAISGRVGGESFSVALWSAKTSLWIATKSAGDGVGAMVADTRAGAWATISGWSPNCFCVSQNKLYFGADGGVVARGDYGGNDLGEPYAGKYVPRFQELGTANDKIAIHARYFIRSGEMVNPAMVCFTNYQIGDFPPENSFPEVVVPTWGAAVWGVDTWGGTAAPMPRSAWQTVSGSGYSLSLGLILGSNSPATPTAEIVGMVLRYEVGRSI